MDLDRKKIISITQIAIMAVLVFLATYLIKVPTLNGYIHAGDVMVFLSVYLLGIKKGSLASALGASLADLLGGYFIWVIPTFIIKGVMAILLGILSFKVLKKYNFNFVVGSVVAGIFQIIAYTAMNILIYGSAGIFNTIISDTFQTSVGIILFLGIFYFLEITKISKLLKKY